MLNKIELQSVASYQSLTTLETDKKVNLIYGLNGTGKSTLSNYLYDPYQPQYASCSIDISSDERLLVYNQKFIQDHFFVKDNLRGIFSLSKENKDIEQKIKSAEAKLESLSGSQSEADSRLKTEKSKLEGLNQTTRDTLFKIKQTYAGGDRVLEYCLKGLMIKDRLFRHVISIDLPDDPLKKSIQDIKNEVEALNGEQAQKYPHLPLIDFAEGRVESDDIYGEVIVGNEDSPISGLISKLNNSDWVKLGLSYLPENNGEEKEACPFCQESTISEKLVQQIKGYFDESYEESISTLRSLSNRYRVAIDKLPSLDVYLNCPLSENFKSELTTAHVNIEKCLEENFSQLSKKLENPSGQYALKLSSALILAFNEIVSKINEFIDQNNDRLENSAAELEALKGEFWILMRQEYDQTITSHLKQERVFNDSISSLTEELEDVDKQVSTQRSSIVDLQKSTVNIEEAVTNINTALCSIGMTDFAIEKYDDKLYRIVRSKDTEADFTSLSEGEKMIISFLYFCEVCKGKRAADEAPKKKIVVIDDPVSSLSHIYVYNIGRLIIGDFFKSEDYEQIFLLTHSLYFFYELTDTNRDRRKEKQELFRISKNQNGASIAQMKYEEIQNDYHSYWAIVLDKNQSPALIANCMRNIVEYFFNFVQRADLSVMTQKPQLRDQKYQAFIRYMNRESHSLGQNIFDFKEFDYDVFRDGLRLVFEAMGYNEHYKKMVKSISIISE